MALAGALAHAGWDPEEARLFIVTAARVAGDHKAVKRGSDVKGTFERLERGRKRHRPADPGKADRGAESVVDRLAQWLQLGSAKGEHRKGEHQSTATVSPADWPIPESLGNDLPKVELFSSDLLPESFRSMVEDVSERMQTPPDFAAATTVVALAGCVNRRATIQPLAKDTGWLVVPNLFGANVGSPGLLKSPVVNAVVTPVRKIDELWRQEYESNLEHFELDKEEAELRLDAWRQQYKQAVKKKGAEVPIRPDSSVTPPLSKRLIIIDATVEKLHEILGGEPRRGFCYP